MPVRPLFATLLTAAAVIGLTVVTAAVTATITGNARSSTPPGAPSAAAALSAAAPSYEGAVFVPITPCRIVDTRLAGGRFGDNVTRAYRVHGASGFTAQGGNPAGCGIPINATAIAASFTANSPADRGYVRAWPSGMAAEPNATVLNYTKNQQDTAGAIVAITDTVTSLKVRNHHGPVDLAIDVTGYYMRQIEGTFAYDGTPVGFNATLLVSYHPGAGQYILVADQDLTGCVPVASGVSSGDNVAVFIDDSGRVDVIMSNSQGTRVDEYFQVQVTC